MLLSSIILLIILLFYTKLTKRMFRLPLVP